MERVQAASPTSAESGAACISCHGAVDGPRCSHCGAAQAAGDFRVLRVIAQTAHSRMYLAEDRDGRRVALKELMFALVPGVEQLSAFEREAAVLRALAHSQIPAFVRAFQEGTGVGTRLYLAQEFIEGESLQQRVARQRLTEDEAWGLAEQVLEVLHHLHAREPRLVHRDVKPANLILRERGPLALVDFGAVRDLARELTHGSTLVGTFGYMPPEQLGGTVDATSDLYALGATLLHGLTGVPPSELLVDGMELRFEHKLQGVSGELRAFLGRLVARRRTDRFPSAAAALEVIRARGQTVLRPEAVERAKAAAGTSRKWFLMMAAAATLALGVVAGAVTMIAQGDPSLVASPSRDDVRIDPQSLAQGSQAGPVHAGETSSGERGDHRYAVSWEKGIKMKLAVGERWPIPLKHVKRVATDDPAVVDVSNATGELVMIGVRPGRSGVVVWTEDGQEVRYSVTVPGTAQ